MAVLPASLVLVEAPFVVLVVVVVAAGAVLPAAFACLFALRVAAPRWPTSVRAVTKALSAG